jgi:hypothetical protein
VLAVINSIDISVYCNIYYPMGVEHANSSPRALSESGHRSETMARCMGKAYADRERDIERWKVELAVATTASEDGVVDQLHRQIAEAKQVIADSGY